MSTIRRLAYCSAARGGSETHVPPQLAGIVIQIRHFNKANGITGYLSYRAGSYFQVLEGPADVLDALYARISRDSRHTDVELVLDRVGETERLFHGWHLQLASRGKRLAEVDRFFDVHGDTIANFGRSILHRLTPFMPSAIVGITSKQPAEIETVTQYQLKSIPLKLSNLDSLPKRMQVLSAILVEWMSVDELAASTGLAQDFIALTLDHPVIQARLKTRKFERADDPAAGPSRSGASSFPSWGRDRLQSFFSRFF